VDASIGGKLGIDFQGLKNHIGMFREPEKIFIHTAFLKTLSQRELRSGFAEVIKHSLIADHAMFGEIKKLKMDQVNWEKIIPHSVKIKYRVILEDPEEKGLRKILNFGHTVGHAIESFYLDRPGKRLLHGEAIAVGMICESWLSTKKTGLPEKELDFISNYLMEIYNPARIPTQDIEGILTLAVQDKKNKKGIIKCAMLQQTGQCTYDITVTSAEIREAIHYYNDHWGQN
jgi:3-dehydroquinate synthase